MPVFRSRASSTDIGKLIFLLNWGRGLYPKSMTRAFEGWRNWNSKFHRPLFEGEWVRSCSQRMRCAPANSNGKLSMSKIAWISTASFRENSLGQSGFYLWNAQGYTKRLLLKETGWAAKVELSLKREVVKWAERGWSSGTTPTAMFRVIEARRTRMRRSNRE